MGHNLTLILSSADVTQILDALSQRLKAWKHTEQYLQTGYADHSYCIEECSDAEEAGAIAKRYATIIESIEQQTYDSE